ncbi:MAG: flavodoxin family protein [Planctomycetota bacterium]
MNDDPIHVAGIYGSPRKGGNSATLLDAALAGAEERGADVERIHLQGLDFAGCQNCGYCSRHGECVLKDDMSVVYDALDHRDVIVLAAPIYFTSVPAQTKAMIDRCQPYWARKYVLKTPRARGDQAGGFVCCCGFEDDRFLPCTEKIVKTWYFILGVAYAGPLFIPGLDARGDAERHPSATDDARRYGGQLVEERKARE